MIIKIKMEATPDLSKRVQEIVFTNGGKWYYKDYSIENYVNKKFIYINSEKSIWGDNDKEKFKLHRFEEISPYDFIASQGEQKWLPKYGEKALFDKYNEEEWVEDYFWHYRPKYIYPFVCSNISYKNCKPLVEEVSFIQFLKVNNAYEKYMHNVKIENQRWDDIKNYIKLEELKKQTPFDWICYAFDWELQKEGNDFWGYLNDKWLNIIEENNNKQIVWE